MLTRTITILISLLIGVCVNTATAGPSELKADAKRFASAFDRCMRPDLISKLLTNDTVDGFVKLMAANEPTMFKDIPDPKNAKQRRFKNALASTNSYPTEAEKKILVGMNGACSGFNVSEFKDARLKSVMYKLLAESSSLEADIQENKLNYIEIAKRQRASEEALGELFSELGSDVQYIFTEKQMQKLMQLTQSLPKQINDAFKKYYDINGFK